jgi:hypothetical protein
VIPQEKRFFYAPLGLKLPQLAFDNWRYLAKKYKGKKQRIIKSFFSEEIGAFRNKKHSLFLLNLLGLSMLKLYEVHYI